MKEYGDYLSDVLLREVVIDTKDIMINGYISIFSYMVDKSINESFVCDIYNQIKWYEYYA